MKVDRCYLDDSFTRFRESVHHIDVFGYEDHAQISMSIHFYVTLQKIRKRDYIK